MDVSRYKALFLAEATEHIRGLEESLLALERDGAGKAMLERAFRHAHSLKGMAGAMGYEDVQTVAHGMEDLLEPVRRGAGIESSAVEALLAGVDAMNGLIGAIARGDDARPGLGAIFERLRAPEVSGAIAPLRSATAPIPPRATGPVSGGRRFDIEATIEGRSSSPAVRAFIVVRKLTALGTLERCSPSVEDIRAGRFDGALRMSLHTVLAADDIEKALRTIPDVETFTVVLRGRDSAPAVSPSPALPAAPERLPVMPRAPAPLGEAGQSATVRVRTELLDRFMDSLTDLILAKAQIAETAKRLGQREMDEGLRELERAVRAVHDRVMEVRLLSVSSLTDRLPRLVRDLAVRRNKRVRLSVAGGDVEVDRAVVEALDVPLLHLVRNAVDHGIEAPEERLALGKPPDGVLRVLARRERGEVVIEVADDGRGIDVDRLRAKAQERGLLDDAELKALDPQRALELICLPGLSTASEVTDISGRGVGMDAVKTAVESLGGRLEIASERGVGTRFVLRLPVTVTVVNVLTVREAGQLYAFSTSKVERTLLARASELNLTGPRAFYRGDAGDIPVVRLSHCLGLRREDALAEPLPLLVVSSAAGPVALAVDALLGQNEVVLRPLGKLLERIEGLAGVTIFGDGRPVFLLDGARLVQEVAS